jgi:hypothetical protein
MGSSQSIPSSSVTVDPAKSSTTIVEREEGETRTKKKPPSDLSGPALVQYKCRKKQGAWRRCVNDWYGYRFLPGKALEDERSEEKCDELFEKFRQCYMRGMLTEQKKKGLEIQDGSMIAEFIDEEGIDVRKK